MSFDINGVTWTPESASTHALDMLASVNAYRQSLGLSQLSASPSNALWLMLLACGGNIQAYDEQLAGAINSFNLALCTDQQILNLLPIAGTTLIPATYSTVDLLVTAGSSGDATITAGTLATYNDNGVTVSFIVGTTVTVTASTSETITLSSVLPGEYIVIPGQINSFSTNIPNLASVTNPGASIPGTAEETPAQARQRLISGNVFSWGLDGCIRALRALQGVNNAQVYFNYSSTVDLTLTGGVVVPPRNSYVVISGTPESETGIAEAYSNSMTAPTSGIYSQIYETLSNQLINIYYDQSNNQDVYVKVYYDISVPVQSGYVTQINDAVLGLQAGVAIGQVISVEYILSAFDSNFGYASIIGASVSLDGISWYNKVVPNANSIPVFSALNTSVVGQ